MQDDKDFSFIQENVKPKRKNKWKKFLMSLGTTLVLAVVFGVVACATFYIASPYLKGKLGKEESETRRPVSLTAKETPSSQPSSSPTSAPDGSFENDDGKLPDKTDKKQLTIKDYSKMNSEISSYALEIEKSVVTVINVKEEEDIFENTEITADSFYGLIVADNGEELLMLAPYDRFDDYSRIEVMFSNHFTCEASIVSYDRELSIAVLAIPLDILAEDTINSFEMAKLGDSYYLSVGTPLLALGSPNGYVFSRELGVIMNQPYDSYIQDNHISLFNTDMKRYEKGEGFVVNFNGEVVGIQTHKFDNDLNRDMYVFLGISKIKPMIEKLLNQEESAYFGIIAKDMTQDGLSMLEIENGIYIYEVIPDSPAYKAGLANGDIIMNINQQDINSVTAFSQMLNDAQVKDKFHISVLRTAKEENFKMTVDVILGKR